MTRELWDKTAGESGELYDAMSWADSEMKTLQVSVAELNEKLQIARAHAAHLEGLLMAQDGKVRGVRIVTEVQSASAKVGA